MDRTVFCTLLSLALLQSVALIYIGAEGADINERNCSTLLNNTECCIEPGCAWCLPSNLTSSEPEACKAINETSSDCNNICKEPNTTTEAPAVTTHSSPVTSTSAGPATTITSTTVPITTGTTERSNTTVTEAPSNSTTVPITPCPSHTTFDAASFIGGIVLGLGLITISCFAYRYYMTKCRPEAPYHQF